MARLCLDLLEPSVQQPASDGPWLRLRAVLLRAAQGSGPPSLSAEGLAERLTEVEYRVTRPEAGRSTRFRRFVATIRGRFSVIPRRGILTIAPMPSSFCGFLRGTPYVVRFVEPRPGRSGCGEWLVEMPGIPPIMFPGSPKDSDATVRRLAERYLMLVLPEELAAH